MARRYIIGLLWCVGVFLTDSCIDPYNPSTTSQDVHYLVVDGFLDNTEKSCVVILSRTMSLVASERPLEENALVQLEDEDGVTILLNESNPGEYVIDNFILDQNKKYRIRIVTEDNTEYTSDFVSVLEAPPIDSITWKSEREGLSININTHDPDNNTRYYYWRYADTWEYVSAFKSYFKVEEGEVVLRDGSPEDAIYQCWKTGNSHEVLVSSSNQLQEDVIRDFTLSTIPWESPKIQFNYSIEVEQRAISKDAYEYWQQLKKNTEELGTLFDPLPSSVLGNFKCVSRPSEIVLGYFNVSTVEKMRIFINGDSIDRPAGTSTTTGYEQCQMVLISPGQAFGALIPLYDAYDVSNNNTFMGHYASSAYCADCRLAGGTNVKPDFWE